MKKQLQLIVIILLSLVYNNSYSQVFFEDFENTNGPDPLPSTNWNLPSGNWAVFDNGVNAAPAINWSTNSGFPCLNTNAAYMNCSNIGQGNTAEDYLATPAITVPLNGFLSFSGKSLVVGDTGTTYQIQVKMATQGAQNEPVGYTTVMQWDEVGMNTDCTDYIIDLSAYSGQEVYIAFVMINSQTGVTISGDRWIVDNVQIQGQSQSCPAPTNLFANTISQNNDTVVSWTEMGTATQWEIQLDGVPYTTTVVNPTLFPGLPTGVHIISIRAICSPSSYSEWSSFTFIIDACLPPTNYNVDGITNTSATLNWNPSGPSVYQYEILVLPQSAGLPNGNNVGTYVTGTAYTATGLSSNTPYNFFIRPICNQGMLSPWSNEISFITNQDSIISLVCGGQFIDNGGISANYANGSDDTYTICPTPNSGDVVNVVFTAFDTETNWDGLYVFNGNSINSPQIASTNPAGYVPGGLAGAFWGNLGAGTFTSTSPDGCLTFRFRSDPSVNKPGWVADVICGLPLPVTCSVPFNIAVSNITANSGVITWATQSSNFQTTQSEIIIVPSGSPAPTTTSVGTILLSNTFTTNGLLPNTSYDVYVRAICLSNTITDWSSATTFTTLQFYPPLVANTSQFTPSQLITNVLASNPCIDITNVTSSTGTNFGSVNGIGYFTNTNPSFPLASGLVLSSGNALSVSGPNTTTIGEGTSAWIGDAQLEAIITSATGNVMVSHNASKLEFDFSTLNEFMSFNFLFASEEYGTFQCDYSDAFAFLLTDLETGITTNLAVVPGTTTPVSVVTIRNAINNTNCPSVNQGYFNSMNNAFSSATNFNGQTTVMTASSALIPNHPYHIKLVVADRGDDIFDSAVFIEAGAFTAGPPQCTDKMQLVAFVDANNNGVKDNGESDFSYGSFTVEQNNDGVVNNVTSPIGTYTIYDSNPLNLYDLGFQVNAEYTPYYTMSPVSYNDINIPLSSGTQTFYFPVTLTQGYNDVTVSISPLTPPRPGLNYTNKIVYRNLGVTATSGTINFIKDASTSIVSVSQAGTVSNATGFSYDFVNLQPYETRSFNVTMSVPAMPTVNLGDVITNSASISAPANDINLNNNSFTNAQIVVASFDPNDITEAHGGRIQYNQFTANDYLYYTIRFQNTGTANAINVRLENLLDSQLDQSSIRMVSSSHNYVLERVNNHLVWKFDYINLVSALQSEELSKGYVTYKIKIKPGFTVGTIIPSVANIYFDSNPAVTTNTFNTEFVTTLANANFESGNFALYPNPAQNNVTINLQNTTETIDSITITDVLGKTIRKVNAISDKVINLDISDLSQGVYMIEIKTESNLKQIKKLIKE
jgi:Secretion system C-terminal sorting domain/Fibronectin type III domain